MCRRPISGAARILKKTRSEACEMNLSGPKVRFAVWRSGWIIEAPIEGFEALLRDHESRHGRVWIVGSRVRPHAADGSSSAHAPTAEA